LEETVVTPLGIGVRRFVGTDVAAGGGGSFFVILRRCGGGGLSSPPSSSTAGFLNETCFGFRSMALACGVRIDIALTSFFALAKGFGRITRGRALRVGPTLRLRSVSTLSSRVPSVGAYRVLCAARDRGARPRGNTGAAGRGAGGTADGSTTAAPGATVGASGRTVGAAIGGGKAGAGKAGAAFGGGKAGGFAIPEFQGATLATFSFLL
jgi:hypothetical protein